MANDKTPKQREAERKIRDELKLRRDGGEENIGIRNNKIVQIPFPGGAQQSWASKFKFWE